jgi:exo-beta-1,3-glucanase (GH17 family)
MVDDCASRRFVNSFCFPREVTDGRWSSVEAFASKFDLLKRITNAAQINGLDCFMLSINDVN